MAISVSRASLRLPFCASLCASIRLARPFVRFRPLSRPVRWRTHPSPRAPVSRVTISHDSAHSHTDRPEIRVMRDLIPVIPVGAAARTGLHSVLCAGCLDRIGYNHTHSAQHMGGDFPKISAWSGKRTRFRRENGVLGAWSGGFQRFWGVLGGFGRILSDFGAFRTFSDEFQRIRAISSSFGGFRQHSGAFRRFWALSGAFWQFPAISAHSGEF